MRKAIVSIDGLVAGSLTEKDQCYQFTYDASYAAMPDAKPVSLTLPIREAPYESNGQLFAFFDGLIPEGWLLTVAEKSWKVDPRDRMGLLLACCKDCIGNVSVEEARGETS
jgi:serine/threonine-protein kinase HipA